MPRDAPGPACGLKRSTHSLQLGQSRSRASSNAHADSRKHPHRRVETWRWYSVDTMVFVGSLAHSVGGVEGRTRRECESLNNDRKSIARRLFGMSATAKINAGPKPMLAA